MSKRGGKHPGELTEQQKKLLQHARELLDTHITYRELECIRFLMLEYPASSIAKELDISIRTTEYYISSLKAKCKCQSKWHLSGYLREKFHFNIDEDIMDALDDEEEEEEESE